MSLPGSSNDLISPFVPSTTRLPGPIAVSAALQRALVVTEQARAVLGMERPSGPAHLFLDALAAIESEFGMKLHDDIVAVLALRDPVLELFTGLTLDGIAQAAEELGDGELHARVGISRVYHEPVGEYREGLHGGPYLEFFTTRRPARNEARIWVHEEGHWWSESRS